MLKFIVVNDPKKWGFDLPDVHVISSRDYISRSSYGDLKNVRVFNLSNDYSYQSRGYYVSLLAEARGHKPLPDVKTILDLKSPQLIKVISEELDNLIQRSLKHLKSKEFILSIYFGKNISRQYDKLSYELYKHFQSPFIRAKFVYSSKKWNLQYIKPIPFKEIPEAHISYVKEFAEQYFLKKRYDKPRNSNYVYDLAILSTNDTEACPSNKGAIRKFIEFAEKMRFNVEVITKKDFYRLNEFDALFIRDNTNVNNYTYKFARKAQSEGLAIIDYPDIILRCSNKVYITEILKRAGLPTPRTMIVHTTNKNKVINNIGLPCVLKLPDSSFSLGVVKANTADELYYYLDKIFEHSDLAIAQQYMYTEYDWRICILDGKPLFACKYFMASGHWQIYNWKAEKKSDKAGDFECVSLNDVPPIILENALKAASLVFPEGLFGVDLKEINGKSFIIEINDNPNIDYKVEDSLMGDEIYIKIIEAFINRLDNNHNKINKNNFKLNKCFNEISLI